jgi:hypothetical protein
MQILVFLPIFPSFELTNRALEKVCHIKNIHQNFQANIKQIKYKICRNFCININKGKLNKKYVTIAFSFLVIFYK